MPGETHVTECDVAIVGYGPTGMVLAALLGQAGHRVAVLERYAGLYNLPRAACFDDEIMRTFQKLGVTDAIRETCVVQRDYDWVNAAGETLVELSYADPAPGGWAALYMMYQPRVEAVLDAFDRALPTVSVHQNTRVVALEQDAEGVTLRGVRPNGQEPNGHDPDGRELVVRARYAVGADGGGGFVRSLVAGGTDDYGFSENWLVCDFRMRRVVPGLPMFRQICDPAQPTSIVRIGPDHHRFSFMLNPGETPEQATRPDAVWARVRRFIGPEDAEMIRVANYAFRSRIAARWRNGRVFLAGDAAHEMPPFLGQGMCSGIRDSHNLAWKLDLVLSGRANDALLDSYQPEREPHVRFITEKGIELGRVQTLRDPAAARARDERMLAQRRANQVPAKVQLPALSQGFAAEGGGSFFPQGRVRSGGKEGLFDDIAGAGWLLLARAPDVLDTLAPSDLKDWAALGGQILAIAPGALDDVDGTYAAWFEAHGCSAVAVRPDWYVYGTARTGAGVAGLVRGAVRALNPETALA